MACTTFEAWLRASAITSRVKPYNILCARKEYPTVQGNVAITPLETLVHWYAAHMPVYSAACIDLIIPLQQVRGACVPQAGLDGLRALYKGVCIQLLNFRLSVTRPYIPRFRDTVFIYSITALQQSPHEYKTNVAVI